MANLLGNQPFCYEDLIISLEHKKISSSDLEIIQQQNNLVNYLDVYEEILFQKTQ